MGEFNHSARKATTLFMRIKKRIKNTDDEVLVVLLSDVVKNLDTLKSNISPYKDPQNDNMVTDVLDFIDGQQLLFDSVKSNANILSYYKKLELKLTGYVEDLNKEDLKRVSLKSEFKKLYKDEKNALKIKIDWTITNHEMKTKHNIDELVKNTFELGNNIDVIKSFVESNIFCFDEFNEDLIRMKHSVEKKMSKFYDDSYNKFRFTSVDKDDSYDRPSAAIDINIIQLTLFNSVELNIILTKVFDKVNFFSFAKKKKIVQLENELKRILTEYTDEVGHKVHQAIDRNSQLYYQSVFDNIDLTFDQCICKSDMTGYLIRSINQCISTIKVPNMNYTVKETILNQQKLSTQ